MSKKTKKEKYDNSDNNNINNNKIKDKIKGQDIIYYYNFIKKNLKGIFLILFIISLISLSILPMFIIPKGDNITKIYNENFKYELNIKRSFDVLDGLYYFRNNEFDSAYNIFNKILKSDSSSKVQLYYSLSAMELKKFDESQKTLIKIIDKNDIYCEYAQWYLMLSYLKTDINKSKEYLILISSDETHFKYNEAKEILKKINKK